MKKKIILTFIVAIFATVILNVQNVFGVGIVSQCWVRDIDGDKKNDLLFRTYTKPHVTTVEEYQKLKSSEYVIEGTKTWTYIDTYGQEQTSKWIYTYLNTSDNLPTAVNYRTIGLNFHTNPLATYTISNTNKIWGYNYANIAINNEISSISNAYNSSRPLYISAITENSSSVFYEIKHYSGSYTNVDWGTGLRATGLAFNKSREYKYAIVNINGTNVYVSDTVVYNDDLIQIIKEAKQIGNTEWCYVSDIVTSATKHDEYSGYEVAYTARDFFNQVNKCILNSSGKHEQKWWSDAVHGLEADKAMGSVLNLFDNKLIFPELPKKTVLVKHINLGDTSVISTDTVKSGTRLTVSNPTLIAYDGTVEKTVTGLTSSSQYSGYQEYYEGMLDVEYGVRKLAIADNDDYVCVGYNVGTASSRTQAQAAVNARVNSGLYTATNQVNIAANSVATDDEVIVIEFYYANVPKEVYANHIYVDNAGQVLAISNQTIKPNNTAKVGNNVITRINVNLDTYIREVYTQPSGRSVTVSKVSNISNYVGYEVFTTQKDVSSIVGKKIAVNSLNKDSSVSLSNSNNVQANFYYQIQKREALNPTIGGRLFVNPCSGEPNMVCRDAEDNNYSIVSIPSGSKATVGIKGIPKYLMAAITEDYSVYTKTIQLNFELKLGDNTKTITKTIYPQAQYYKITDLAIYKLNNATVHDAGANGTLGTSIFNWTNNKLNVTPRIDNVSVALSGYNGLIDASDASAIKNPTNYIQLAMSLNNLSGGTSNVSITADNNVYTYNDSRTYLTTEQLATVDINGDGVVNQVDKVIVNDNYRDLSLDITDAADKVANALATKNSECEEVNIKKRAEEEAKEQYDSASSNYLGADDLKSKISALTNATNRLAEIQETLDEYDKFLEENYEAELKTQYNFIYSGGFEGFLDEFDRVCGDIENVEDAKEYLICKRVAVIYNEIDQQYSIDEYYEYKFKKQEAEKEKLEAEKAVEEATKNKEAYESAEAAYESARAATATATAKCSDATIAYAAVLNEKTTAENNFNNYKTNTYEPFNNNYDSYKALSDEYSRITEDTIADKLGIAITVKAKNMEVKLNNNSILRYSSNNTASVSKTFRLANSTNLFVATGQPNINTSLYTNLQATTIGEADYSNKNKINDSASNGIRALRGEVTYNTQVLIGNKSAKNIADNVYYRDEGAVFNLSSTTLYKDYETDFDAPNAEQKYTEVEAVNIYTPITVSATFTTENGDEIIEYDESFTLNLSNLSYDSKYKITDTSKYGFGYYVKFGFDVHKVNVNGSSYKSEQKIPAGTWIGFIKSDSNAKATITAYVHGVIGSDAGNYTVRAVAYNATELILNESTRYESINAMQSESSGLRNVINNICDSASYFAEITDEIKTKGIIYDFKITDLKDISWKSVFRTNTTTATNTHTGNVYYSGNKRLNIGDNATTNTSNRNISEIGGNPVRILPLGPYKNMNIAYTNAPKLGYRFSYDLKLAGSVVYDNNSQIVASNKVNITTSFYYISKDGNTYLKEYVNGTGIYLFYKNSEGKYVRIDENGGGYELTFIPNDGYRYIEATDLSSLSTKTVSLGNLRKITLTNEMATVTEGVITYYGEYKLPNSTIAVKVTDGRYNINDPLEDGYIGVVFNIEAETSNSNQTVSYSENKAGTNTSQWDYEGFLGYNKAGSVVANNSLYLKLEKGSWNISNNIYNQIKGSVILYDIDQRAATDYD